MPQDARSDGEPQPARVHEVAGGAEGSRQERRAVQVCGGSPHKCGRRGGGRHRAVQVCVWGRGVIVQPAPPHTHLQMYRRQPRRIRPARPVRGLWSDRDRGHGQWPAHLCHQQVWRRGRGIGCGNVLHAAVTSAAALPGNNVLCGGMPVSLIVCCCMGFCCMFLSSSEGILGGDRGAAGSLSTIKGFPTGRVALGGCSSLNCLPVITCRGGPSEIIKHGKSGFQVGCSCVSGRGGGCISQAPCW